jgi:hypothetical protein
MRISGTRVSTGNTDRNSGVLLLRRGRNLLSWHWLLPGRRAVLHSAGVQLRTGLVPGLQRTVALVNGVSQSEVVTANLTR